MKLNPIGWANILLAPIAALVLLSAMTPLAACATGPVLTGNTAVATAKAEYGFEAAYNVAATGYLEAVEHGWTGPNKDKAKAILLRILRCDANGNCTGYLEAARKAQRAGDADNLAAQAQAVVALASEVRGLIGH